MEGKKSFILYSDLLKVVEKLPNEAAGKLFKIILKYVNDQEVDIDDMLLEIAFEPIKNQLSRDLRKWKNLKEKRSLAGKISAEKRRQKPTKSTHVESVQHRSTHSTVNVNDTVNANVNVNVTDILLKKETKKVFGFKKALMDLGVDVKMAEEWILVRSRKKAVNTETAFKAIKKEIEKSPLSPTESIKMAVEKSWSGFKSSWLENELVRQPTNKPTFSINR